MSYSCEKQRPLPGRPIQHALDEISAGGERRTLISRTELLRLLHDLEVYQIELQMQNEELCCLNEEFEESHRIYSDLYDHAPVGYLTLDSSGLIVRVNAKAAEMLGRPLYILIGSPMLRFISAQDHLTYFANARCSIERGKPVGCEVQIHTAGGPPLYAQLEMTPSLADEGGFSGWRVVLVDITARRHAENQREQQFKQLKEQVRLSKEILAEKTRRGLVQKVVDSAARLIGSRAAMCVYAPDGAGIEVKSSPGVEPNLHGAMGEIAQVWKDEICRDLMQHGGSMRLAHDQLRSHPIWRRLPECDSSLHGMLAALPTGEERRPLGLIVVMDRHSGDFNREDEALLAQLTAFAALGLRHIQALEHAERKAAVAENASAVHAGFSDTTELKSAREQLEKCSSKYSPDRAAVEQSLRDSEARLRALSKQLLKAHEDERKRVARDLHDSIGSSLSAVKFKISQLAERFEPRSETHVLLNELAGVLAHSMEESRRIMADLRPEVLDDFGLLATIQWFCKRFQSLYSFIKVLRRKSSIRESDIPEDLKLVIFRILQESMNNAAKYSGADTIKVSVSKSKGRIRLCVKDNGKGFDVGAVVSGSADNTGLGIEGMRERAEISGGFFPSIRRRAREPPFAPGGRSRLESTPPAPKGPIRQNSQPVIRWTAYRTADESRIPRPFPFARDDRPSPGSTAMILIQEAARELTNTPHGGYIFVLDKTPSSGAAPLL